MKDSIYSGMMVDVPGNRIFPGEITVSGGVIDNIREIPEKQASDQYIIPGLVDAHVHIESSMVLPSRFAQMAVTHGTVATVSDPHEIANVLGMKGVEFMIRNGKMVPFKFFFGAPSCVPATPFETSGAALSPEDIEKLLKRPDVKYLAEMMNFPGVLAREKQVMDKIRAAKKYNKPVDGHAPGLKGDQAKKYIQAGITTDHECFQPEEALDKLRAGMTVQIREGSAAKNFDTLIHLLDSYPENIMFCSDDKHPHDLVEGHMNSLVKRALKYGYDLITALKPCTMNPVKHYNLEVGLLQKNDPADFIIIDHPEKFNVLQTVIDGSVVARNGKSFMEAGDDNAPNRFVKPNLKIESLQVKAVKEKIRVIDAFDGELVTGDSRLKALIREGMVVSDTSRDILKIVVVNRYKNSKPAIGFIRNMGLKKGAMASTVAHDSHNIIAVGTSDDCIFRAIDMIAEEMGGVAYCNSTEKMIIPLPVAGIMSTQSVKDMARAYVKIDRLVKKNGSTLKAPFMTLSFMALLVIPSLKISDKGLFDGNDFVFTTLFEE